MIKFFNKFSVILFQELADLKYNIQLIEINEEEKFVGISLDTDNFIINISLVYYWHKNYAPDKNCSVSIYTLEDTEMKNPAYTLLNESIQDCITLVLQQDLLETVNNPVYFPN